MLPIPKVWMPHNSYYQIRVQGVVQGVGFRPFIWQLAKKYHIIGNVRNDNQGVLIQIRTDKKTIKEFCQQIKSLCPPLAKIDKIITKKIDDNKTDDFKNLKSFKIIKSILGEALTNLPSDAITCSDCLDDVFDKNNHRYLYPFTNCTNCGPRISIIQQIPYDRKYTSMAKFIMCDSCQSEYDDPQNRRFHAQPNACPKCGPQVFLYDNKTLQIATKNQAISQTIEFLKQGKIVAIKGLGGFTLCADATSNLAVKSLRLRKKKYAKALGLLAKDIKMIKKCAHINNKEQDLLQHISSPIVLLQKKTKTFQNKLSDLISSESNSYGFCLPSTALHHIIMRQIDNPLIYTSANIADNPQIIKNSQALDNLASIADFILIHDRKIINRADDSVMEVINNNSTIIRRARGFAPLPIDLHDDFKKSDGILAIGGDKKNTFCLIKNGTAILSSHTGNLNNYATYENLQHNIKLYQKLYDFKIKKIACDKHPNYISTKFATSLVEKSAHKIKLIKTQHHHAHLVSVLSEHKKANNDTKYLGVAMDGLGYGGDNDGTLWGGEFMLFNYKNYQRVAHFAPVPLVGGDATSYEPWRNTFAYLYQNSNNNWQEMTKKYADLEIIKFLQTKPIKNMQQMIEQKINSPLSSSAGRLFDAIAGFLNLNREKIHFEAQAAMNLQTQAEKYFFDKNIQGYKIDIKDNIINWQGLWQGLLEDSKQKKSTQIMAAKALLCISESILKMTIKQSQKHDIKNIVLSGGMWQNKLLLTKIIRSLKQNDLNVLTPSQAPSNDGGLSLGQALIATNK
ncbi:MAG: carbamoyltransferase HypF [Gammaproteobacteria bacterium]|nr:MAG: carbamoyltransferase HypF [Gammaproteobacteria bacterium]